MVTICKTGFSKDTESFQAGQAAANMAKNKMGEYNTQAIILYVASTFNYTDVINGVYSVIGEVPLIGASSAGEFTEESVNKHSVVCMLIYSDTHKFSTSIAKGLKEDQINCITEASKKLDISNPEKHYTAILHIDGLAGKGEEITLASHMILGDKVKLAGGAAADQLEFKETRVFSNHDAVSDGISLGLISSSVAPVIAVKHGHIPVTESLTITKSQDSVIYEVNDRPAFDVWKEHVKNRAAAKGIDVDTLSSASEIGNFLLQYEAGLQTGDNYKIRIPLSTGTDGSINFACSMPQGSVIKITESNHDDQIESARTAAKMAVENMQGRKIAAAIIFDCVCRALILGDDFKSGVQAIRDVIGHEVPLIGFETYGEIAMEEGQFSGFHNTTTVVLLLPE